MFGSFIFRFANAIGLRSVLSNYYTVGLRVVVILVYQLYFDKAYFDIMFVNGE